MALAGTYIQPSNSITGQLNQIPGVQAPRSFGYVNPNAGYQGVQFGLAKFPESAGLSKQWRRRRKSVDQCSPRRGDRCAVWQYWRWLWCCWAVRLREQLQDCSVIPSTATIVLKIISRARELTTPDGIPIVEYDYDGKRWRGVIAQEVEKVRPDAVHHFANGTLGVFYSKLGIELQEVQNG